MYVWINTEARSRNHCCRKRALSIKYSECVSVDLFIQHAKRTHRTLFSSHKSCKTQSGAPEDGQNNCQKNVELTGIINKP